jgi:hypothetical protein
VELARALEEEEATSGPGRKPGKNVVVFCPGSKE